MTKGFDFSKAKTGPDGKLTPETVKAIKDFVDSFPIIKVTDYTKKKPVTKVYDLRKTKKGTEK